MADETVGKMSVEAVLDYAKLLAGTKDAGKALQYLAAEAAKLDPKLNSTERSASRLADRIKTLSPEAAAKKMEVLAAAVEKAGAAGVRSGAQFDFIAAKLKKLQDSGAAVPASLKGISDALAKAQNVQIGKIISDEALQKAQGLTSQLGSMGNVLGAVGPAGLAVGAALTAAAGGAGVLIERLKVAAAWANAVGDSADAMGSTVVEAQQLQHAAAVGGQSFEAATGSVIKLRRALIDSPDAFERMGLSARDLRNLNLPDLLTTVGGAIEGIRDPNQQAAMAVELFGKSWKEVAPLIKGGLASMKDAPVVSADVVAALNSQNSKINILGEAWDHFWIAFSAAASKGTGTVSVLDTLTAALNGVSKAVSNIGSIDLGRIAAAAATVGASEIYRAGAIAASGIGTNLSGEGEAQAKLRLAEEAARANNQRILSGRPATASGETVVGESPEQITARLTKEAEARKAVQQTENDLAAARLLSLPPLDREIASIKLETDEKLKQLGMYGPITEAQAKEAENLKKIAALKIANAKHEAGTRDTAESIKQYEAEQKAAENLHAAIVGQSKKTDDQAADRLQQQLKEFTRNYIEAARQRAAVEEANIKRMERELDLIREQAQAQSDVAHGIGDVLDAVGAGGAGKVAHELGGLRQQWGSFQESFFTGDVTGMLTSGLGIAANLAGKLKGLFGGKSEVEKIGEDLGDNMGKGFSQGLLEQIEKTEEKIGVDGKKLPRAIAEQLNVGSILKEGGLTETTSKLISDLLNGVAVGAIDSADGVKSLSDAFSELKTEAEGGSVASQAAMVAMIKRAKELQLSIPEIDAYVKERMDDAAKHLEGFFAGQTQGAGGSQVAANATIFNAVAKSQIAAEGLTKATEDMQPALEALIAANGGGAGLTGQAAQMAHERELLGSSDPAKRTKEQTAFRGAADSSSEGAQILKDLVDTSSLNQETTDAFATTALNLQQQAMQAATDSGESVIQATRDAELATLPLLTQLQHAQEMGAKLSPEAADMLAKAQADGVLPLKSVQEQQLDVQKKMLVALGGKPDTGGNGGDGGGNGDNKTTDATNGAPPNAGPPPNTGHANYTPHYPQGTNFVPSDGLALLHRGEAVVPAKWNTKGLGVNVPSLGLSGAALAGARMADGGGHPETVKAIRDMHSDIADVKRALRDQPWVLRTVLKS